MSRGRCPYRACILGFPRVSGDEPVPLKYGQETTMFSPRERG